MAETCAHWLAMSCLAVAMAGCVYALAASVVVRRFGAGAPDRVDASPASRS